MKQGVTQAQGAQGMAQMAQQLNAANYGQAQSAANRTSLTGLPLRRLTRAPSRRRSTPTSWRARDWPI